LLTPGAAARNSGGVPQAPDAPGAASGAASGAKTSAQFPFPEDVTGGANGSPGAGGAEASGAGGGSSSSSSSSSSDDDAAAAGPDANPAGSPDAAGLKDKGSEGTSGRHLLHRVNPVGTKLQTLDEREAEDLSVARFYTQTGDLQGAYLRSQDAVKTAPDDPDAHFALAEAALRLKKRDEAIAEYNACLKLDPVDKEAKEARKALARLNP
jgi:tetratricopeptide (TPR) repeat protein